MGIPQPLLALVVALSIATSMAGCGGKNPPPQLPTSGAHERAASRIELVGLVIPDGARAAKVRALYVEIERLMLDTKRAEAQQLTALSTGDGSRTEAATRARFRRFRETEQQALEAYVHIQLELRKATTPAEFTRLDAIK